MTSPATDVAPAAEGWRQSSPISSIGLQLPTVDGLGTGYQDLRAVARGAEERGFDALWVGDHLTFNAPVIEAFVAAATAAAVTSHIRIGFGVLVAALRHPAWLAKQLTSLQVVSADRLELGIGIGGEFAQEWEAAGVPRRERGRRTDAVLEALPTLLTGAESELGAPWGNRIPSLLPAGAMPPLWIGGRSDHSLRRATRFGAGWLGVWLDPPRVRRAAETLSALAGAATPPPIGVEVLVHPGAHEAEALREAAPFMESIYGIDFERIRPFFLHGEDSVVAGVSALIDAGASTVVLIPAVREVNRHLDAFGRIAAAVRPALDRQSSLQSQPISSAQG